MKNIKLKYGDCFNEINIEEFEDVTILKSMENICTESEEAIITNSIENPIDSKRLKDLIKDDYKICIVIPDVTRLWQKPSVYLPLIVKEIEASGAKYKEIKFLCALGTHRKQSEEEQRKLVGDELYERFEVVDHDCRNENNLVYVGTTSFNTPVIVNKIALDCDLLIITGGIVFHDMAGFGGGRKSILPGISSYESIMANHSLSLNKKVHGINPKVKCASMIDNPFNEDMMEAAKLVKPDFLFNVITDSDGNISGAVSGNFITAHSKGCMELEKVDGVKINEKADLVIASCGGYPKDIDLYQGSKALSNAKEAIREGGTIILLAKCVEGVGHIELLNIITEYDNNESREMEIRKNFTIAKYTGYLICDIAEKYNLILVSDIDKEIFKNTNISLVNSVEEAFKICFAKEKNIKKIYVMPNAANTLPIY